MSQEEGKQQRRAEAEQRRENQQAQRAVREERRAKRDERRAEQARRAKEQQRLGVIGGIILVAVAVVVLLIFLNRPPEAVDDLALMASPIPEGVATSGRLLGNPEAPVQIVEYGDYQCPFCGTFALEGVPQLIDEFVATGQANFEYRDLAFLGEESTWAAEAAACADDQGAFWPFHKTVFANQNGENQGAFTQARLEAMAEQLGLEMTEFTTCFNGFAHTETVAAMADEAAALGINSTPTFVINGTVTPYSGLDDLRAAINDELDS